MKTCSKCGTYKALSEFYAHPYNTDGRSGKCKECTKADVKANREAKLEYYQSRDRDRAFTPDRVALRARVREARRADPVKRAIDHHKAREWGGRERREEARPRRGWQRHS